MKCQNIGLVRKQKIKTQVSAVVSLKGKVDREQFNDLIIDETARDDDKLHFISFICFQHC